MLANKKWLFLLALFLAAFTGVYFLKVQSQKELSQNVGGKKETVEYALEGKIYKLLVADEPEEWQKGLMYVKEPEGFDGMLFIFPDKKARSFWNKNTFVDLDVYWILEEKVVGKSFLPSVEKSKKVVLISSPEPVDKVVEIIKR